MTLRKRWSHGYWKRVTIVNARVLIRNSTIPKAGPSINSISLDWDWSDGRRNRPHYNAVCTRPNIEAVENSS
eukprot:scaffold3484_cov184-Amphora_coffeaeformis.AAC.8